jgi:hypothetical protein
VVEMVRPYFDKGFCVYFTNYFTSFDLLSNLLLNKTFACGTLRENRKYYPKHLMKKDREMATVDFDFASSKDISVCKWKDRSKKSVIVASTFHNPATTVNVSRTNKVGQKEEVKCPESISEYNKYMGGVDKFDQYMSYYIFR